MSPEWWLRLCSTTTRLSEQFFQDNIDMCRPYLHSCKTISYQFWDQHCYDVSKLHWVFENPHFSLSDWEHLLDKAGTDIPVSKFSHSIYTLPVSFWEKHLDAIHWFQVCRYQRLPLEFWERHLDRVDWFALCFNTSITWEFWEKHLDHVNWFALPNNTTIPTLFWEAHLDLVDWSSLCRNSACPVEFWEKYLDRVDWSSLCVNKSLPLSFWAKYRHTIYWDSFLTNPTITVEFIEQYFDFDGTDTWTNIWTDTWMQRKCLFNENIVSQVCRRELGTYLCN